MKRIKSKLERYKKAIIGIDAKIGELKIELLKREQKGTQTYNKGENC